MTEPDEIPETAPEDSSAEATGAAPTEDPRPDGLRRAESLVVVNTGNGKGKSSAAFGTMLRALARGWNVAVVQFVKSGDWKVGEESLGRQLGVDWHAVGDGFTWDSDNLDEDRRLAPELVCEPHGSQSGRWWRRRSQRQVGVRVSGFSAPSESCRPQ